MRLDAYYANLEYHSNWDISDTDRQKYQEEEIKARQKDWEEKVGRHIAKIEKMAILSNGLVKYAFLDKYGHLLAVKVDADGKYETKPETE